MSTLERAVAIAHQAHAGVPDKAGAPYVQHPLRVMGSMSTEEEKIVAVLHDVVEDSNWTFDLLRAEGFSEEVLEALEAVTKRPEEEDQGDDSQETKVERYLAFVSRAARNPIGRRVKLADLRDNLDMTRISTPTDRDFARIDKYKRALAFLEQHCQEEE